VPKSTYTQIFPLNQMGKKFTITFIRKFRFLQNKEFANLITSDYPECSDVCNDESTESCLWNDNILDILSKVRT